MTAEAITSSTTELAFLGILTDILDATLFLGLDLILMVVVLHMLYRSHFARVSSSCEHSRLIPEHKPARPRVGQSDMSSDAKCSTVPRRTRPRSVRGLALASHRRPRGTRLHATFALRLALSRSETKSGGMPVELGKRLFSDVAGRDWQESAWKNLTQVRNEYEPFAVVDSSRSASDAVRRIGAEHRWQW